ncbi:hypothetical protein LTR56_005432 [Elasticomyces elasticus]|nr:hypothetical protein LTR22_015250 [Elasticomyces elasticus]KAK3651923.1 hypothetical protein LTR56_005432 [Elasticomyces elasticus]KAK4927818.1 hypothetical protein LTR49_005444 [Elasticomyces elasticus]KAK5750886.1 hypothetical protein LTS12_019029 [Elasticomyces elasticus]
MRLLELRSLRLHDFLDADIPPYAILSHRWGRHELTYRDWQQGHNLGGPGFRWYERSTVCYAHLADFSQDEDIPFTHSDWFNRGWTLQELLAPCHVLFCDSTWRIFGHKCAAQLYNLLPVSDFMVRSDPSGCNCWDDCGPPLNEQLARRTGIDETYLDHPTSRYKASIACRMSWAAQRTTSRVEDVAYSLLGIFDVYIPALYGEGENAFRRLQEELIRRSDDQSVFAWACPDHCGSGDRGDQESLHLTSMLAPYPSYFTDMGCVQKDIWMPLAPYSITNRGLEIRGPVRKYSNGSFEDHGPVPGVPRYLSDFASGDAINIYLLRLNCGVQELEDQPAESNAGLDDSGSFANAYVAIIKSSRDKSARCNRVHLPGRFDPDELVEEEVTEVLYIELEPRSLNFSKRTESTSAATTRLLVEDELHLYGSADEVLVDAAPTCSTKAINDTRVRTKTAEDASSRAPKESKKRWLSWRPGKRALGMLYN